MYVLNKREMITTKALNLGNGDMQLESSQARPGMHLATRQLAIHHSAKRRPSARELAEIPMNLCAQLWKHRIASKDTQR